MRKFIFICFIIYLTLRITSTSQEDKISNNDDDDTILLPENSKVEVKLSKKSGNYYRRVNVKFNKNYDFAIVQSHSQYRPVVSSLTSSYLYGYEETSTNGGVVKRITNSNSRYVATYVSGNIDTNVNTLLLAVPSVKGSPIPGGCCLVCALELDPNIKLTYGNYKTYISFQRASRWTPNNLYPDCDNTENPQTLNLKYTVYLYYINENDFSENELYDGLWKMSTPASIKKYGNYLTEISGADSLAFITETIFGRGVILNVIVSDRSLAGQLFETAYVPVSTYACNFTVPQDSPESCHPKRSIPLMIACILFALIGLALCFAGFKLFRCTVFMFGLIFYWFFIFIALSKFGENRSVGELDTFIISFMVALCGGGFTLFLYSFKSWFYVVYLELTLVFGMFVSAIIFYTPFGYLRVWDIEYRFALGFSSCALFITMVFLFFPKALLYVSTSLLGSYAVIMVPCYFLRANIDYIVLTVIYRFTIKDFGTTFLRRPFGKLEYILTGVWGTLLILGVIIQYCTTKNDKFFFSGTAVRHKMWDKFSQSVRLDKKKRGKRSPTRMYYENLDNDILKDQQLPVYNGYQNVYGATSNTDADQVFDNNEQSHEFPLIHEPHRTTTQPLWAAPSAPPAEDLPLPAVNPTRPANLIVLEENNSERQPLLEERPVQRLDSFQKERYPKIV